MHVPTTLLPALISLLTSTLAAPTSSSSTSTSLTTRGHSHTGTVRYCADHTATSCAPIPVGNQDCHTLARPFHVFDISAGLKCTLYANPDCTKQLFSSKGKVKRIEGHFDASTDARAKAKGLEGGVQSFFC
jgi:hypothetical protein